jgi:succinate dehydrogenase / fumarate reductase flavoprotein subunit
MEVGPTMHYIMGGIRVDAETAESRVPGLFAAGETSGGMHGANRLGGNSLSDLIVFGRRAGLGAAAYAKGLAAAPPVAEDEVKQAQAEMEEPFSRPEGKNPYDIAKHLNQIMSTYIGIFREEAEMKTGIAKLEELKAQLPTVGIKGTHAYNPGWHLCRDLRNMFICSEAIARSALARKESRGAHSRLDFPNTEDDWGKVNSSIFKKDGEMALEHTPTPIMPDDLKDLFLKKEPAHA